MVNCIIINNYETIEGEEEDMVEKTMDKIVALAKSRGFVYPGSEIYGGLANTWDYGNLGVELHGGRSSFRNPRIMLAWTAQY